MSLASAKKLLLAGGGRIRPQDVFATTLFKGTGSRLRIVNGLNLAGKGGLVWGKARSTAEGNYLFDSQRLRQNQFGQDTLAPLSCDQTGAEQANSKQMLFEGNGFSTEFFDSTNTEYVSWALRRAKKFLDIVTWTGNGVAGRKIAHGLGVSPGMIIVKARSLSESWIVKHRTLRPADEFLLLNSGNGVGTSPSHVTAYDSESFTVGINDAVNKTGVTYVAYLFAQNPDLIDCGSYVGNGQTSGPAVICGSGWKPQWLLAKSTGSNAAWVLLDAARGVGDPDYLLQANTSNAEVAEANRVNFTSTGFQPVTAGGINASNQYIYMAIRSPT